MADLTLTPEDITGALRRNLEGWNPSIEAETVGYVDSVGDGVARVSGSARASDDNHVRNHARPARTKSRDGAGSHGHCAQPARGLTRGTSNPFCRAGAGEPVCCLSRRLTVGCGASSNCSTGDSRSEYTEQ